MSICCPQNKKCLGEVFELKMYFHRAPARSLFLMFKKTSGFLKLTNQRINVIKDGLIACLDAFFELCNFVVQFINIFLLLNTKRRMGWIFRKNGHAIVQYAFSQWYNKIVLFTFCLCADSQIK